MKRLVFIALMLIGMAASAVGQNGKVVVYRRFYGIGHAKIYCDGLVVAQLAHLEYSVVSLPSGHHYCTAFNLKTPGVAFDLRAGESLYFEPRNIQDNQDFVQTSQEAFAADTRLHPSKSSNPKVEIPKQ